MTNLETILNEITEAEKTGSHLTAAEAYFAAGKIYLERNSFTEAAHYLDMAAELFLKSGQAIRQAQVLNQLGVCLVMSGQIDQALAELSTAKEYLNAEDHPSLIASIEGNRGLAYSILKDYKNAVKSHKYVLETAEKIADPVLKLNALINLADCNLQDKKYRPAQGFALVALDLALSMETQPSLGIIYDLLGMVSSRQADLKTALEYHQKSYAIAQKNGDLLRQGIALANQALAWEGLTELAQANQLMSKAQDLFVLLNSDYQEKTNKDLKRIRKGLSGDL